MPASAKERGSLGGKATCQKYGSDYLARIGRKGGRRTKLRAGDTDFYEIIGIKGGETTLARYGKEHYANLGKQSATINGSSRG